jgi:hypothetical protein
MSNATWAKPVKYEENETVQLSACLSADLSELRHAEILA